MAEVLTVEAGGGAPNLTGKGTDTRKRERKPRAASSAKISGKTVEEGVTAAFNGIATVTQRPHWRVADPAQEVAPWAGDMATVLNKIPGPAVDRVLGASALISAAIGLGTMVVKRVTADQFMRRMATDPVFAQEQMAAAVAMAQADQGGPADVFNADPASQAV